MEFLRYHPLLTLSASFAISAFCLRPLPGWGKLLLLGTAALAIAAFGLLRLFTKKARTEVMAVLLLSFGILGGCFSSWLFYDVSVASVTAREGQTGSLTAEVLEVNYRSDHYTSLTVRCAEINGEKADFKLLLELQTDCDADAGDVVSLPALFSLPPETDNGFPVRSYYAADDIHLFAACDENGTVTVTKGEKGIESVFRDLSSTLSARLRLLLGKERGGFLSGILLGRRDDTAESTRRDFRYLGLSHVLAVSGLHLSILTGGLLLVLRLFHTPLWLQTTLASLTILFFVILTGFPASVIRSGIMLFLNLIAFTTGDRYHPPTALAFSAAVILMASPGSVSDAGFLLSVSSTAGILALGSPLTSFILKKTAKKPKPVRYLGRTLATMALTASAVFFTLPFTAYYFGEFSLVSPLFNLIYLPLIGFLLYLGIFSLLFFGTLLQSFTAQLASDVTGFLLDTAEDFAKIVIEPVSLRYDFTAYAFAAAVAVFLLLFALKQKRLVTLFVPLLAFSAVFGGCFTVYQRNDRETERIVAVNFDRNDYLLIHSGGKTLLCDFSTGSYSDLKNAAALSSEILYDSSPDALLLTHLHTRHIASFSRLADNARLTYLILPTGYDEASLSIASALAEEAEERGIRVVTYNAEADESVVFDRFTLTADPLVFLDRSVQPVCRLTVEGRRTLTYLGGGINEREGWDEVKREADRADLILLGIHGPLIKTPLDGPFDTVVFAASQEVNECYGVAYTVLRDEKTFYRTFVFKDE